MEVEGSDEPARWQAAGAASREADRLWRWQGRLLPFMVGAISLLALFFFVSSIIQLDKLNQAVALKTDSEVTAVLADLQRELPRLPAEQRVDLLQWKTKATLEAEVIRRRYQQVNSTLQLRAWTRHMGFMTGMIMAFVGAIFILSKLKEQETNLSGEYQGIKAGLATSSPGIILAALGTALMFVTILVDYSFGTRDVPVYLVPATAGAADLPPPKDLAEPGSDAADNQLFPPDQKDDDASKPQAPTGQR